MNFENLVNFIIDDNTHPIVHALKNSLQNLTKFMQMIIGLFINEIFFVLTASIFNSFVLIDVLFT